MTAHEVSNEPRSRRALLAGLLGGVGVWAASLVSQAAAPALAAAGDPIRMGRLNKASSTATTLQTKTSSAAYQVTQIGGGAAVKGVATSGRAIMGEAGSNGTGVWGSSLNHIGVHGRCWTGYGVWGEGDTGVAAFGDAVGVYAQGLLAARFSGPTYLNGYADIQVALVEPDAPGGNVARLFSRQNAGETELCVKFSSGAVQVLARRQS
jgi:hypothetical protein